MGNRYVEFVKKYAKDNDISYHCAMCEIQTKKLYVPLNADEKKNANLRDKTFIKVSKLKAKLKKLQRDVIDAQKDNDKKNTRASLRKFDLLKIKFNKKLEEYRKLLDLFNKLDAEQDAQNAEPKAKPKTETKAAPKPKAAPIGEQNNANYSLDDFKSKAFLVEAIDLYYRDKGKKISNLSKQNMAELKEGIIKRNIPLDELVKFHNMAIDKEFRKNKDSDSDKIKKLRKKWKTLYIYPDAN